MEEKRQTDIEKPSPRGEAVQMSEDQELYDTALEAITKLFSNTSIPRMVTRENLKALIGEIETMLDSLEE